MNRIVDLHMHIVPGVDDGSQTIEESLEMLRLAQEQGVTDVFCTSHNGDTIEDAKRYINSFEALKYNAHDEEINIRLHKGCEVLCDGAYMEDVIYGLLIGVFSTLGNTNYVLAELYPDAGQEEALHIIRTLGENGYKPIIAHMERNYNISTPMVNTIIQSGALIQVNLHSFVDERSSVIKSRARELLENRSIHFVGSDSHQLGHRPPNISSGAKYITDNTDVEYAKRILSENAVLLLTK